MPLTPQEKAGLSHILQTLLDADEPEAMLAALRRLAERKAFSVTLGKIDRGEAERWQRLADALRAVQRTIRKAA